MPDPIYAFLKCLDDQFTQMIRRDLEWDEPTKEEVFSCKAACAELTGKAIARLNQFPDKIQDRWMGRLEDFNHAHFAFLDLCRDRHGVTFVLSVCGDYHGALTFAIKEWEAFMNGSATTAASRRTVYCNKDDNSKLLSVDFAAGQTWELESFSFGVQVGNPCVIEERSIHRLADKRWILVSEQYEGDFGTSLGSRYVDVNDAEAAKQIAHAGHVPPRDVIHHVADMFPELNAIAVNADVRIVNNGPAMKLPLAIEGNTLEPESERSQPITESVCKHSTDFTSVVWFGIPYEFSKGNQAESIRVLWDAWESGTPTLSQETIGEEIAFSGQKFRLDHVFKPMRNRKRETHPAWEKMIRRSSNGAFFLSPP